MVDRSAAIKKWGEALKEYRVEVLKDFKKESDLVNKLFLYTSRFGGTRLTAEEIPVELYAAGVRFSLVLDEQLFLVHHGHGYRPSAPFEIPFTEGEIKHLIECDVLKNE